LIFFYCKGSCKEEGASEGFSEKCDASAGWAKGAVKIRGKIEGEKREKSVSTVLAFVRRHLRHPRKIKPATVLDCSIQTNLAGKL